MKCAFVVDFCLAAHIPGITPIFLNACGGQGLGAAPLAVCCRNRLLKTSACHELGLHWGFMRTVPYNMTVFECESMVAAARLDTSACKRYLSTRYATYRCCPGI